MTDERSQKDAERRTRNVGLTEKSERLHDPEQRTLDRSEATEPEQPPTPPEAADQDLAQLENPPQSEGPRERSNDAV